MSLSTSELMLPPQACVTASKDDGSSSSSSDTKKSQTTVPKRKRTTSGPVQTSKQLKHDAQAKRLLLAQAAAEENVKLRAELVVLQSEVTSLRCLLKDTKTTLSVSIYGQSQKAANEAMMPPEERYTNTFNTFSPGGSAQSPLGSIFNGDYNTMTHPLSEP